MGLFCCMCGSVSAWELWWVAAGVGDARAMTGSGPWYPNSIRLNQRILVWALDLWRVDFTWERPCFDSWEEYPTRRHTTSWAAIAKGLVDSGNIIGEEDSVDLGRSITANLVDIAGPSGKLPKFVPDADAPVPNPCSGERTLSGLAVAGHERLGRNLDPDTIDGSALLVIDSFGPFEPTDHIVSQTLNAIEHSLVVGGGVHRYLEDEYYGGGLWTVLAGALACAQAHTDPIRADEVLSWIEAETDIKGHLGEQTPSSLRHPESLDPWIERWGQPAKPLLWSHAMYLLATSALDGTGLARS